MRPSSSLRSVLVIVLLLAGGFAGAASCGRAVAPGSPGPVPLDEAVRRTIAAGSARLAAILTGDGVTVSITGVTSWREPRSEIVAEAAGVPPVEVRVTPAGTWLRSRPETPWARVPADAIDRTGATGDWRELLTGLRPVGPPGRHALRATHAGAPATVDLDAHGRIRRLRVEKVPGRLDLRLSDHGIEVAVVDP